MRYWQLILKWLKPAANGLQQLESVGTEPVGVLDYTPLGYALLRARDQSNRQMDGQAVERRSPGSFLERSLHDQAQETFRASDPLGFFQLSRECIAVHLDRFALSLGVAKA